MPTEGRQSLDELRRCLRRMSKKKLAADLSTATKALYNGALLTRFQVDATMHFILEVKSELERRKDPL